MSESTENLHTMLDITEKNQIYNQIQMVLGGHNAANALHALLDNVAVVVVTLIGDDRARAHSFVDSLVPILKMATDNHLDLVGDHLRMAALRGDNKSAGNA